MIAPRLLRAGLLATLAAVVLTVAALTITESAQTAGEAPKAGPGTREALFVGNNWDGTADIVDPMTFKVLERFNVVPDLEERMAEVYSDPVRTGYFFAIRQLIGEGNDQFVDDMFSSHDGRFVYISRPSLADVIGMDLATKKIVWRFVMDGQRSDHMAISPDGKRLLISDSTGNKVHELEAATGKKVGEFESGDSPHENNYSADGKRIFHASIGLVYTPSDTPIADSSKGDRYFQIVEAGSNKILKRLEIGPILEQNGFPGYSSAVRPMAISPDEKTVYMQLSFFHGFVVFDVVNDKPIRLVDLPKKTTEPRENYLLDSAHHGLSVNHDGTKLCVAGTMDGYAAIVSTETFAHKLIEPVDKPYWSTNSGDGKYCFVSSSGSDEVVVIDYASEREVARIRVGDHPQRMRMGVIREEIVGGGNSKATVLRAVSKLRVLRARIHQGRLKLKLRINAKARGRVKVSYRANRRTTRYRVRIPSARRARKGMITFNVKRRIPKKMRRARSGRVDVRYSGSKSVTTGRDRLTARRSRR